MFHALKSTLAISVLAVLFSGGAFAAGGNDKSSTSPAGTPQTVPGSTRGDPPRTTTPDGPPKTGGNGSNQPGGPTRGGGLDGLPDAVTVLEILRGLPQFPHGGGSDIPLDDVGPDPGSNGPTGRPAQPGKPSRVVTIPSGTPFVPAAAPRPAGAPAAVIGAAAPEVLDREVLVTLPFGSDANTVFALSRDLGLDGQTVYTSELLGTRIVRFRIPDTRSIADVVQQLATDARVEIASPHYVYTASQGAAKALPVPQYAPAKLKLSAAHKIAEGKRIKIAVIDTSIDVAHPAFGGVRIETFDALGESKPEPEQHGTAIAGIVGARADLEGVAPKADLLSVRAFTAKPGAAAKSYTLAVLKGLDWAATSGARVVNMSFAGPQDPILEKALKAAGAQGIVLVAAAGNGGPQAAPAYPAAYPIVIAVTATDTADELYKDANRGSYIAIAAPGVDIIAAAPKGAYDVSSGTSLAAAHVSGIAALMLEKNPKFTGKDVRAALTSSAQKLSGKPASEVGAGVADAAAALGAGR